MIKFEFSAEQSFGAWPPGTGSVIPASFARLSRAKCCPSAFEGCCSFVESSGNRKTQCMVRKACFNKPGGRLVGDSRCC